MRTVLGLVTAACIAFASTFGSVAFASTFLNTWSVWPGSQTKLGYFNSSEYCQYNPASCWFYHPVDVYGYTGSVDINTVRTQNGGYSGSVPLSYTSWSAWDTYGHWTGSPITPLGSYTVGSYFLTFYPYLNALFTNSRPAYSQIVIFDANVSVNCRWTNYNQMLPY